MGVDLNDPRQADARGWGKGWPNCQISKIVPLKVGGTPFPGGVRREIHNLLELLLTETEKRGYKLHDPGCWGFACRAIKNPDGSLTNTPSNHSWGLAIDVNAPTNVFGGSTHTIPGWMPDLFNRYGFRWGGDYSGTKDWMHFEFMGTREDAQVLDAKAEKELGEVPLTEKEKDAIEFAIGIEQFAEEDTPGGGEPKDPGPRRRGYRWAQGLAGDAATRKETG
jgi:hypothetical protein